MEREHRSIFSWSLYQMPILIGLLLLLCLDYTFTREHSMQKIVCLLDSSQTKWVKEYQLDEMFKRPENRGTVVSVTLKKSLELKKIDPTLPLLHLDSKTCLQSWNGLKPVEIEAWIGLRKRAWSPQAEEDSWSFLYRSSEVLLGLLSRTKNSQSAEGKNQWNLTLKLSNQIYGSEPAYATGEDWELMDRLMEALDEFESQTLSLEEHSEAAALYSQFLDSKLRQSRKNLSQLLLSEIQKRGKHSDLPPGSHFFFSPMRVVAALPLPKNFLNSLEDEQSPVHPIQTGAVLLYSEKKLDELRSLGATVTVLGLDGDFFIGQMDTETPAFLDKYYTQRIKHPEGLQWGTFLGGKQLRLLFMLRAMREGLKSIPELDKAIKQQTFLEQASLYHTCAMNQFPHGQEVYTLEAETSLPPEAGIREIRVRFQEILPWLEAWSRLAGKAHVSDDAQALSAWNGLKSLGLQ